MVQEEARDILDRLFIKRRLPDYSITARDIVTTQLRLGLQTVVSQLMGDQDNAPPALSSTRLRGPLDVPSLQRAADYLQQRAVESAASWFAACALIVGDSAAGLGAYRTALLAVVEPYVNVDEHDFLNALQQGRFPELDRALEGVKRSLLTAV
ncbi:MAG: hypothetical protein DLM50_00230 [Candidatus Meridianibacter frigidus]|nr:MAG: hypothetical protein DLM50_00230 [Candidatus Eremiobacteraeota bacterium]